jgi:hypothetical protein
LVRCPACWAALFRARSRGLVCRAASCSPSRMAWTVRMRLWPSGPRQPWTYWLTPDILSAEEGRCLVDLGRSRSSQVSLARVIHRSAGTGRDRVLYGAALVQAHLAAGDLDQACEELRRTAGLLGGVSSQRCRVILRDIVDNLSCRRLPWRQRELVVAASHMLITDGKAP